MNRAGLALILLAAALAAAEPEATKPVLRPIIDGEVLHANRLSFVGLVFHDVVAQPRLRDDVLTFADCSAKTYGGRATATIAIDLARNVQTYRIAVTDIDLVPLIAQFAGGDDGTRGRLDGWLELTVPAEGGTDGITGRGELSVRDGDLVRLGLLSSLLIGDPTSDGGSDTARAQLSIAAGRLQLKGAAIRSPGALVKLRGSIGFDGSLDLIAIPYPEFAWIQIVPGIGDAAAWLLSNTSSRLARATIRGTLGNPAVVVNPFAD
jgi:hypothetical protein